MAKQSESAAYQRLRSALLDMEPRDRLDRIENIVVAGMPDVNYCIDGTEGWIEIKAPTEPKRISTKLFGSNHKLSQEQMNWFLRQRNASGAAYVLIVTDKRWMLLGQHWADEINGMAVRELMQVAAWHAEKPIRREQWSILRNCLKGK